MTQDLRFAFRLLLKKPGFTLAAVLALSLGIGANTTVFSFVNAFLLRPMPFESPDRLVHLWSADLRRGVQQLRVSAPDYRDWREAGESFEDLGAFNYSVGNLTGQERPSKISTGVVTANVFDLLGVQPLRGRVFRPGEDQDGKDEVALISEDYWRNDLQADPGALSRTLKIDGREYRIVGIMPDTFNFPLPITQVWIPRVLNERYSRGSRFLQVVGRLKAGVTAEQAQAEMSAVSARLAQAHPDHNADMGVWIQPLRSALNFADQPIRIASLLLTAATLFVLLIACANVAGLLLSRASARQREMALRTALGAGRARLLRQLLIESLLVALCGGALGVVLAFWGTRLLADAIPARLYKVGTISVDSTALLFTLGLALATTFVFGLLPALRTAGLGRNAALKEVAGAGLSIKGGRLQGLLVTGQVTLCMILLAGSTFMARSLLNLQRVEPGFATTSVLSAVLTLPKTRYPDPAKRAEFHRTVVERVRALPSVMAASTVNYLPLNNEYDLREYSIEGRENPENPWMAVGVTVSQGYFETMGIPLLRGRVFDSRDPDSVPSVVISRTLAQRHWPDRDPVGESLSIDRITTPMRVIGVVEEVAQASLDPAQGWPQFYRTQQRFPGAYFRVLVRARGDAASVAAGLRQSIWSVDPELPITQVRTLDQVVEAFLLAPRSVARTMAVLSFGALLLATVGIYAMMAFYVNQRVREIGIRLALGASRTDVLKMVAGRALRLAGLGIVLGLIGAFVVGLQLTSILYQVKAGDPWTLIGAGLFLLLVSLAAAVIPARRAGRVDPMQALRWD